MTSRKLICALAICVALTLGVLYTIVNSQKEDGTNLMNTFEEAYEKALRDSSSTWLNYNDTCYVYLYRGGGKPNSVLASFDMDDTLIKPKSNPKLPRNSTDWEYLSPEIRILLDQVTRDDKARFLVFSNQHGIKTGHLTLASIQERIELMVEGIGIPCTVFIALGMDEFRKPGPGMFRLFERSFKGPVEINYGQSFYCGDAIGYPAFSDSDLKFAQTLGLPFINPDDFLLKKAPKLVESN